MKISSIFIPREIAVPLNSGSLSRWAALKSMDSDRLPGPEYASVPDSRSVWHNEGSSIIRNEYVTFTFKTKGSTLLMLDASQNEMPQLLNLTVLMLMLHGHEDLDKVPFRASLLNGCHHVFLSDAMIAYFVEQGAVQDTGEDLYLLENLQPGDCFVTGAELFRAHKPNPKNDVYVLLQKGENVRDFVVAPIAHYKEGYSEGIAIANYIQPSYFDTYFDHWHFDIVRKVCQVPYVTEMYPMILARNTFSLAVKGTQSVMFNPEICHSRIETPAFSVFAAWLHTAKELVWVPKKQFVNLTIHANQFNNTETQLQGTKGIIFSLAEDNQCLLSGEAAQLWAILHGQQSRSDIEVSLADAYQLFRLFCERCTVEPE